MTNYTLNLTTLADEKSWELFPCQILKLEKIRLTLKKEFLFICNFD